MGLNSEYKSTSLSHRRWHKTYSLSQGNNGAHFGAYTSVLDVRDDMQTENEEENKMCSIKDVRIKDCSYIFM